MKQTIRFTKNELKHLIRESVENYQNNSDLNKINSQFKHVEIYPNPLSDGYQVRIVSFPSVPPLSGTKEQCIADAFKLEAKAEAKLNQLIQKAREDGYSEEEIQMAVNNRLKHSDEMNESRGLGYGLSDKEKRKVRDEHSDMRKHSHYTGRGVKGKPGEKSKKTYDILKREGDKGNPWSKTLKKGGTADWVANMHDDDTNESVGRKTIRLTESDISRMIMEAMNELDWKTYANAAKKRFDQLDDDSVEGTWNDKFHKAYNLEKAANSAFDNEYIGDMKYDTLGDKLKGKHSPTFNGYMQLGNKDRMPYGVINGYNKGGGKIFSTDKGVYHSNGGGLTTPGKFFKNKEVADAYSKANDELWDYDKGNYRYEKGKGWTKDELEEAITRAIRKYLK